MKILALLLVFTAASAAPTSELDLQLDVSSNGHPGVEAPNDTPAEHREVAQDVFRDLHLASGDGNSRGSSCKVNVTLNVPFLTGAGSK